MTGREVLDRQARRLRLLSEGITVIFVGSVLSTFVYLPLGCGGVLLAFLIQVFVGQRDWASVQCLWCGTDLGPLVDRRFRLAHVRFCPHCAKSPDEELTTGGRPRHKAAACEDLA